MKTPKLLFVLMLLATALSIQLACEKEEQKDPDPDPVVKEWTIYVYGRPSCGFCSSFMNGLDAESIPYTFYNIDDEPDKNSEMWSKLNAAGMGGGSVGLPVVDVVVDGESHLFIRPNIGDDIKPLIQP
jgi:glutaredoxin